MKQGESKNTTVYMKSTYTRKIHKKHAKFQGDFFPPCILLMSLQFPHAVLLT